MNRRYGQFTFNRVLATIGMLAAASVLVFASIHLLPGDPVTRLLGEQGSNDPTVVNAMRERLGLNLPLPLQYVRWLAGVLQFDFGRSLQSGVPVAEELLRRIPRSLELIFSGLILASAIGIPLGVAAARWPKSVLGRSASLVAALTFSSPGFVTGLILILIFSLWLGILPSSGYTAISENVRVHFTQLILPAVTLAFGSLGIVIRATRASLLDVLAKDFVRTARAKGLDESVVVYRHALKNALVPVVAIIGVRAGGLLGGTVIIESLFNWPGLSSLVVQSCYDRDYPMIQGSLLAVFGLFAIVSLFVDLIHASLDPRIS